MQSGRKIKKSHSVNNETAATKNLSTEVNKRSRSTGGKKAQQKRNNKQSTAEILTHVFVII